MYKGLISIFLLIIFSGCSSNYISNLNSVTSREADKICKEECLELVGSGGAMMDCITRVDLCFVAYRRVDLSEARRLSVKCIEDICDAINSQESLKPYLQPYPFPRSAMAIGIIFNNPNGGFVEYGCAYLGQGGVSVVDQLNGKLFFGSYNPRTGHLEPYYNEPYEVALAIVQGKIPAPEIICQYPSD